VQLFVVLFFICTVGIISHGEEPWIQARDGKDPWEACDNIISEKVMKSFYKKEYARECAARQATI
jgi:hypothetical protein